MSRSAEQVSEEITRQLLDIPPNDRIGFLFGIVVGLLQHQGMNEQQIRTEIFHALNIIYDFPKFVQ